MEPVLDASRIRSLRTQSFDILSANRRVTNNFQYTVPSPATYPYQWLWDSCFHAIVLARESPEDAKRELRSLLSRQFDNGMLPHMIYWQPGEQIKIEWGRGETSSITQPPLVAEAAWRIYQVTKDDAFLKEIYPSLFHFYNYLLTERDPRAHRLAGILNPDESGEDNSPRFDEGLGLPPRHSLKESLEHRIKLVQDLRTCNFDAPFCMREFFWVKDAPFNAILSYNLDVLAQISETIGYGEEGAIFRTRAQEVSAAMRARLLEDGVFWSASGKDFAKITVKTWGMFAPLYAGMYSSDEARQIVDNHLLNPKEFRSAYFVPTVSMDEPSFDPEGFWRGPVWMASNWFVFRGLVRYGHGDLARRVLESSAALLERSGFREYFNPDTGEGYGAQGFTWGALVVDMIDEAQAAGIIS
jgi:glycogen debranching enzyme